MDKESDTLCTVKEACFTEKAGRTTIYKRIKEGHYRAFKIGGSTRISVASLRAYRKPKVPTGIAPAATGAPVNNAGGTNV
jgi:excisionase family DNA binding protein